MSDSFAQPEFANPLEFAGSGSLHEDCRLEEEQHKWRESEKAQRDLGEQSIYHWVHNYWLKYLMARWIEHIEGKKFWIEFGKNNFGIVQQPVRHQCDLFDPIYEKVKAGEENLHVICWAKSQNKHLETVHRVLEHFNINGRRIPHRLEKSIW